MLKLHIDRQLELSLPTSLIMKYRTAAAAAVWSCWIIDSGVGVARSRSIGDVGRTLAVVVELVVIQVYM